MFKTVHERFLRATDRPQSDITSADMEWFGVRNLRRAAKAYNTAKHGRAVLHRRVLHRRAWPELAAGLGEPSAPPVTLRDGWAIDDRMTNPVIPRVLAEAEELIAERGLTRTGVAGRGFIRDILEPSDLRGRPSFLDFLTSPDVVLPTVAYLRQVPVVSRTVPPAIRLTESSIDGQGDKYTTSQLYHLDIHDTRLVYAILLLRDATPDSGPFTFLPAAASARVAKALRYTRRGAPFRLTDEQVHEHVDPSEAIAFTAPAGTVLFLDSSRCLHFGSRDAHTTRYQLMCAFVSPARSDFTEERQSLREYPDLPGDPPLRRLLLDKRRRYR